MASVQSAKSISKLESNIKDIPIINEKDLIRLSQQDSSRVKFSKPIETIERKIHTAQPSSRPKKEIPSTQETKFAEHLMKSMKAFNTSTKETITTTRNEPKIESTTIKRVQSAKPASNRSNNNVNMVSLQLSAGVSHADQTDHSPKIPLKKKQLSFEDRQLANKVDIGLTPKNGFIKYPILHSKFKGLFIISY